MNFAEKYYEDFKAAMQYEAPHGQAHLTEEERRVKVLVQALHKQKGLTWVENELARQRLRKLYLRNPVEFVLRHVFLSNEVDGAYKKYSYADFLVLWEKVNAFEQMPEETFGNPITFGSLHDYVEKMSKRGPQSNDASTARFTMVISQGANQIDVCSSNAEEELCELYREYLADMVEAVGSVRFYICRTLYYIICNQILELKSILSYFSATPAKEVYHDLSKISSFQNRWSLLCPVVRQDLESRLENNKKPQLTRQLLQSVLDRFVLKGTPADDSSYFKVLYKPNSSMSDLKNLTPIFPQKIDFDIDDIFSIKKQTGKSYKNKRDAEQHCIRHAELKKAIEEIKISDFFPYPIDLSKLYDLIFELPGMVAEPQNMTVDRKGYGNQYLSAVLFGKQDMSRSTMLLFFASAKGLLFKPNELTLIEDLPFAKDWELTGDKVNAMLNRCGYVDVGDEKNKAENVYLKIFDSEWRVFEVVFESLADAMVWCADDYGYSPIPFEVKNISSQKRREKITKGRSK